MSASRSLAARALVAVGLVCVAGSAAVAGAAGEAEPATPGADVIVNDPAADNPPFTTQNETTLAVLGSTLCAAYVDTRGPGVAGFSRSADAGATWADRGAVGQFSDPVLAVHKASRRFYYGSIAVVSGGVGVGVSHSDDDCRTFSQFANASPQTSGPPVHDKPWIAVDNSGGDGDGNVYVCWTRFAAGGEIRFSRSVDGGITFTDERVISTPADSSPFGCSIAVGPEGGVSAVWVDRSADLPVRFRRSLDGGFTWGDSVQVNTAPSRHAGFDRRRECEAGKTRRTLNGDIRMLPQAWMAVDTTGGPFTGNIYVVWTDDPAGAIDNSDVWLSHSTDGGRTWTPEIQIAGGTETDQFEPFVAVGGRGTVSVAWYDRRNDPAENLAMDVYALFSRDGGAHLDPLIRLTDASFAVPPLTGQPTSTGNFDPGRSACYMGEYIAVAAGAEQFYYAWGDNRNVVVTDAYPEGRPDPDVFFDRLAVPRILHPGDANCDGRLTAADLPALVSLVAAGELAYCVAGDVIRDGEVNEEDAVAVTAGIFAEPVSRSCGGMAGASCRAGEFCELAAGSCGVGGESGRCESRPVRCLDVLVPVCGCDGVTYDNDCFRKMAGIVRAYSGPCA